MYRSISRINPWGGNGHPLLSQYACADLGDLASVLADISEQPSSSEDSTLIDFCAALTAYQRSEEIWVAKDEDGWWFADEKDPEEDTAYVLTGQYSVEDFDCPRCKTLLLIEGNISPYDTELIHYTANGSPIMQCPQCGVVYWLELTRELLEDARAERAQAEQEGK